jgi:lipid-A-disaccharide synthase
MQILLSAGEASGDNYGAQLIEALRRLEPQATFFGMGGEKMRAAGCELLVHANDVAVVGLVEVVKHLPNIRQRFHRLVAETSRRKPDAAVLIDFPDFNLRLACELHRLGVPVFYFISPQIWAWRTGRVKQIQKYVRKMIVIFPFESEFYKKHGVDVVYVGHPLAYATPPTVPHEEFARVHGLNVTDAWIALLPGSRQKEVRLNLPVMLEAAEQLSRLDAKLQFLLPVASTLSRDWIRQELANSEATSKIKIALTDPGMDARTTLAVSRAAIVASGTATVEAALAGTPFVAVYRLAGLTWLLGRRLVRLDTFAMPNLIAGTKVIPELIQGDFTAENVVRELRPLLADGPQRETMLAGLAEIRTKLRDSAHTEAPATLAAQEILAGLK